MEHFTIDEEKQQLLQKDSMFRQRKRKKDSTGIKHFSTKKDG